MKATNVPLESSLQVFNFDPADYAKQYAAYGYVHVKGGINSEFLSFAQSTAQGLMAQHKSLKEWEFKGKKQQFLFDFPEYSDFPYGVKKIVADVTGLPVEKITLCERHIKAYEANANPTPAPHKDRVASEVAVGIPLIVPESSYMIVYPQHVTGANPYNTTAQHRRSLDEEEWPERLLAGNEPLELDVQPGDAVMFRGSALYHERVNPANTVLLYLKFNAMRLDPIGEDPSTLAQRDLSLELLENRTDQALLDSVVEVSPQLERISRHYTRLYWKEMLQVYVSGQKEFTVSEDELQFIRNTDGSRTVRQVLETLGVSVSGYGERLPRVRRIIKLGGIDILKG